MFHDMIGGTALNFKVIGNPQPATAKENTIWIDTDEINGWAFSVTEPDPVPGMIWIQTDTYSTVEFNALKHNGVMVYPVIAKQYVNGAWVQKTAMSYQNGQWVDWIPVGALYYFGDQCDDVSGGWNAKGWKSDNSHTGTVVPSVSFKDDHMKISVPNSNNSGGAVEVGADQDLTNVNRITIDFEVPETTGYVISLIAINRKATYLSDAGNNAKVLSSNSDSMVSRKTMELDVSGLSGSYDIAISFYDHWSGSGKATIKVYSVIKE